MDQLFVLRFVTVPAFCPSKPYFFRRATTHYSFGWMTTRGSGRNNAGTGRCGVSETDHRTPSLSSQTTKHSQHQSYSPNLGYANQMVRRLCVSRDIPSPAGKTRHEQKSSEAAYHGGTGQYQQVPIFDICQSKSGSPLAPKPSLLAETKEKGEEQKGEILMLRPGMVLLKKYISPSNQIKIINKCQELGSGPGGFYQPNYQTGAKIRRQIMCLGMDWDPKRSLWGRQRSIDGAIPPSIPVEFKQLVEEAIRDSHAFMKQDLKLTEVEKVLPGMSPDVCIINFYTEIGGIGLHQDKSESTESLRRALPIVSFSIGDSAQFLYEMKEKVVLESGDILIFGGPSRHIYHGVSHIFRNTAPSFLIEEAKFRPGRLNLTFRKF